MDVEKGIHISGTPDISESQIIRAMAPPPPRARKSKVLGSMEFTDTPHGRNGKVGPRFACLYPRCPPH
jgi:hypothetical protein